MDNIVHDPDTQIHWTRTTWSWRAVESGYHQLLQTLGVERTDYLRLGLHHPRFWVQDTAYRWVWRATDLEESPVSGDALRVSNVGVIQYVWSAADQPHTFVDAVGEDTLAVLRGLERSLESYMLDEADMIQHVHRGERSLRYTPWLHFTLNMECTGA